MRPATPKRGRGRRASRGGPRFPGAEFNLFKDFPPDFPGARRLPKRRTEPLRPHAEERRIASRLEAGSGMGRRSRLRQPGRGFNLFKGLRPILRALIACRERRPNSARGRGCDASLATPKRGRLGGSSAPRRPVFPGADSTFSRLCARFSGRSSPAEAADRTFPPSCRGATQRVASRSGLGQAAAPTSVAIPGAESTFSRTSARFSGRSSPAKRRTNLRPHAEERRKRVPAAARRLNPGRGINLLRLPPDFRALVACRSGGPNLSALMPRSDAARRVPKPAP